MSAGGVLAKILDCQDILLKMLAHRTKAQLSGSDGQFESIDEPGHRIFRLRSRHYVRRHVMGF